MAYSPPHIGSAGLTVPSYNDILDHYTSSARKIFGQNIYLANDSADFQLLSTVSLSASDAMKGLQLSYNSFDASTVVDTAQDQLYRINGIARKKPTHSICPVVLTGTPGTVLTNAKVRDQAGYFWSLPSPVTILASATPTAVIATCDTVGAISAAPGTITIKATPTYGWESITNYEAAVVGFPVETNSQFRARQTKSTALASISPVNSIEAVIAQLAGVARSIVYENPTGSPLTDPNGFGLPAHSITAVVEGGDLNEIATAIWTKKTPGTRSNGSTTVLVTDSQGKVTPINFFVLAYTSIYVTLGLQPLAGFSSGYVTQIRTAIVNYLNSLAIGEAILSSALKAVAMNCNPNLARPVFGVNYIYIGYGADPSTPLQYLPIDYNFAALGSASNVTINV